MRLRVRTCVATLALLLLAGAAYATDELTKLLGNLSHATDPKERLEAVERLATEPAARAAQSLRDLVRGDPDATVRVAAAAALGRSPVPEATKFLLQLVVAGGPKEVRRQIGRSIARRRARMELVALLGKLEKDQLGGGLVVEALVQDESLDAAGDLERLARGADAFLRAEAIRGLARHPVGKTTVAGVLKDVLANHHDLDTVLAGLDVAEFLAEADLRAVAEVFESFLEPEVQGAVQALKQRLAYLDAVAKTKAAKKDGYSYTPPTDGAADPPPPRARVDIVYVYDATGSVCSHLDLIKHRIKREAEALARIGADYRIGLVAYRDTQLRASSFVTLALPLTYDLARAETFLDAVGAAGADSMGACVTDGLEQALDRMGWRWDSRRQVGLIADSKTGVKSEQRRCMDLVRLHYKADHTRVNVWYLYRTRAVLPPDIAEIAAITGGVVESLE